MIVVIYSYQNEIERRIEGYSQIYLLFRRWILCVKENSKFCSKRIMYS